MMSIATPRGRRARMAMAGAVVLLVTGGTPAAAQQREAVSCRPAGTVVRVDDLPEGSGVAARGGRAWAHNDSGQARLVALDEKGAVAGRIRVTGMSVNDWEAISIGPCDGGSCLYLADIGDNEAERETITIYRLPLPDAGSTTVAVRDRLQAKFPDGAQDAETLLITPTGQMFIVTKGDTGPVAIYRFPAESKPAATVTLERVGKPRDAGRAAADSRITDGAVSPDGRWAVLRTERSLHVYAAADLLAGNWREAGRVNLAQLKEPQGEGVAFADRSTLYLVGEGGGGSRPGTFARLTCTF